MKNVFLRLFLPTLSLFGFVLWGVGSGLTACQWLRPQMFSESRFLMDTIVDITVVSRSRKEAETAISAAYAEMERIELLLSTYVPKSQISAVNQHAGEVQAIQVAPEVIEVVQRSQAYWEDTYGAFNMALGPVIELWGIGTGHEYIPTPDELQRALRLTHVEQVEIGKQTIRLAKDGMSLNLGGIAKGYSIDQALAVMQHQGIQHALLNAGGDIRSLGVKPDGSSWRIGIQHPRTQGLLGIVELQDAAITTSGDYERFFVKDNVRYHHLIDPQSGTPARGCQSVTILTSTAEAADVYSTAVFIIGPEQGLAFIEQHPDLEGMIVRSDGELLTSSGFTYTPAQ